MLQLFRLRKNLLTKQSSIIGVGHLLVVRFRVKYNSRYRFMFLKDAKILHRVNQTAY